jgi:hypothetical protein
MITHPKNRAYRVNLISSALISVLLSSIAATPRANGAGSTSHTALSHQSEMRIKIAAGEYEVVRPLRAQQGIGSFTAAVYDFHESWTLWRLPNGNLQAEGHRTYDSPRDESHHDRFDVHLSAALQAVSVTEYRKLRWRPNSGPVTCDFLPREVRCASGPNREDPKINLDMQTDYGFLWPVSAFCLGGITHSANRAPLATTAVQLITVDEISPENPVATTVLDAELKFIRTKSIAVAGRNWDADEFQLKAPMNTPFLLWTSKEGLVLLFGPEGDSTSGPETGLQLVRYEKFE